MTNIKTSDLTGVSLDWAVAKCEGLAVSIRATKWRNEHCPHLYSTDWTKGGPIIEREFIQWQNGFGAHSDSYLAEICAPKQYSRNAKSQQYGTTQLIAAMRCYVVSKLGDTVDIPDELGA